MDRQTGDIIACRKYLAKGANGEIAEVVVSLWRPLKIASGDYACHYEITFSGQNHSVDIQGVDEIAAVINVLAMAGSWINGLNESTYEGRLAWEGGGKDLGLPRIEHDWPFERQGGEGRG